MHDPGGGCSPVAAAITNLSTILRNATMALKDMLDQMLAAGRDLAAQGQAYAEQKLNVPSAGPERDAALSNLGKGALAGGALALLLGTSAGRKLTGTAAALGGLGALGQGRLRRLSKLADEPSRNLGLGLGLGRGRAADRQAGRLSWPATPPSNAVARCFVP
jgi:hypothetical protein